MTASTAIRKAWNAWRGHAGDEIIMVAGLAALLFHVANDAHKFPDDLLPIAVFAALLLHGRWIDRREPQA